MVRAWRLGFALAAAGLAPAWAQESGEATWPPLPTQLPTQSDRVVAYELTVTLQEDGHTLDGTSRATWRNTTSAETGELFWHVYNNAWAGRDSVWLREAHLLGDERLPRRFGGTEIHAVRLMRDGADAGALEWDWVQAPGTNDRTVMRTELPEAVEPGGSVTVEVEFTADLPPAYRRSGSDDRRGYVHAAQWFPKLGVFEEREDGAAWNCRPYHYLSEFYSDYGSYRLVLTLPRRYLGKVAATGTRIAEQAGPETITYTFEAKDVHDFAWTADPDFLVVERPFAVEKLDFRDRVEEERVARALGRTVEEILPQPTRMILMLQPEHEEYEERYLDALAKSLYYFGLWYGTYPYETISLIDPANDAGWTGGMEYPRLITGRVDKGKADRTLSPEGITVHEFGHQFWYGLVGNDEFLHAWLDEGFCVHSSVRVERAGWEPELATYSVLGREFAGYSLLDLPSYGMEDSRGLLTLQRWESPGFEFLPPLSFELRRRTDLERWLAEVPAASYVAEVERDSVYGERRAFDDGAFVEPVAHPTFRLLNAAAKGDNSYGRAAITLETMARLMGEDRWTRVMRAYQETWRYRHPQPDDFLAILREYGTGAALSGENDDSAIVIDWDEFWEQAIRRNDVLDYAVTRLHNRPAVADPTALPLADGTDPGLAADAYDVTIEVRRLGAFRVPVEIRIEWDDGTSETHAWDGRQFWWRFHPTKQVQKRATRVVVDPQFRLLLDCNWLNNSLLAEPETRRAQRLGVRALIWAQQVLHHYGGAG